MDTTTPEALTADPGPGCVDEPTTGAPMSDESTVTGEVVITLTGPDGVIKAQESVHNLITDAGDQYHAKRIGAGVAPAAMADVTKVTGMKVGSGTTAAAKSGAGAALVTYVTGGNKALDASYPTVESLGAGLGWTTTYQCTLGAGVGTGTLSEVVLVTDSAVNATSAAADTIARVTFTAVPKAAADVLTIGWAHKQLGA